VLFMTKGTALFDAVAISGTEALVRAGLVRRCAVGERVSADGVRRPIAVGVAVRRAMAVAWCAWRMGPSRSRAARSRTARRGCVRPARVARPRAVVWYNARCGTADGWRARCGARMLRRSVYGVRRIEPEWSV
jgi:hypothetical protein